MKSAAICILESTTSKEYLPSALVRMESHQMGAGVRIKLFDSTPHPTCLSLNLHEYGDLTSIHHSGSAVYSIPLQPHSHGIMETLLPISLEHMIGRSLSLSDSAGYLYFGVVSYAPPLVNGLENADMECGVKSCSLQYSWGCSKA